MVGKLHTDKLKKRKYLSEFGIDIYPTYTTFLPVSASEYAFDLKDGHKYHLYFVLSLPRVFFDIERTTSTQTGIVYSFILPEGESDKYISLPEMPIHPSLNHKNIIFSSKYPHNELTVDINDPLFLENHTEFVPQFTISAQDLFIDISRHIVNKLDFEVLYIGQSYGKHGERIATDRLSSHSTLQKILSDCQGKYADKSIYLLLIETAHSLITTYDGINKEFMTSNDEDNEHVKNVLSNLPAEAQIINVAEAAMIHYFKPEYNTNFIENFPDKNHKGYQQYYHLDYNTIRIDLHIDQETLPLLFFHTKSNTFGEVRDVIEYKICLEANRASMYDLFVKK